eukprot:1153097-Pelagomonas_calceolata.AAC.3
MNWVDAVDDPELVCMAHAHGVRVVANAGDLKEALSGPVKRVEWVLQKVNYIIAHALDGINFDLEEAAGERMCISLYDLYLIQNRGSLTQMPAELPKAKKWPCVVCIKSLYKMQHPPNLPSSPHIVLQLFRTKHM